MMWSMKPKLKYVKVLIQQFEGNELIEPNKHYSKCLLLYGDATPKGVYDELLPFLSGKETGVSKNRTYHLSRAGRLARLRGIRKYWKSVRGRKSWTI